jgi:alcohol dehydrogenase (cytochrome c)
LQPAASLAISAAFALLVAPASLAEKAPGPDQNELNQAGEDTEDWLHGVLWNGPAFNPRSHLLYVPSVEWCTTYTLGGDPKNWLTPYFGGKLTWHPVSESRGRLTALDAATGEVLWRYESDAPMAGAVTTTASDVLFTGEVSGDFLAMNARDGKVLYRFNTGGAVAGGVRQGANKNETNTVGLAFYL